MALNLYMVSQNCDITTDMHPFLKPKVYATSKLYLPTDNSSVPVALKTFSGIIYANGTVDETPPEGFRLGRAKLLKAGTVFGNGTVLAVDTPNAANAA